MTCMFQGLEFRVCDSGFRVQHAGNADLESNSERLRWSEGFLAAMVKFVIRTLNSVLCWLAGAATQRICLDLPYASGIGDAVPYSYPTNTFWISNALTYQSRWI